MKIRVHSRDLRLITYTLASASQNQPLGSVQLFSSLKPLRRRSRAIEAAIEFVAVLGMDALAFLEMEAAAKVLHPDGLFIEAFQMHLNARLAPVPEGEMLKAVKIKAAAEFAIDAHEHVLVEGGGHALSVIVSGVKNVGVFDQIKADEQRVAWLQRGVHALEKCQSFFRLKVADGGADEESQLASGQSVEVRDLVRVVGDDGADAQPGKMSVQCCESALQRGRGDVDGIEIGAQLAAQESFNEHLRFAGAARAQLHQREIVAGLADDLSGILFQYGALGARGIVLRRLSDLLKQVRACGVIKKFGRQLTRRRAQAAHDFISDRAYQNRGFINCRHLRALSRKIATEFPGGKKFR